MLLQVLKRSERSKKNASNGAAFFLMRAQEVPSSERRRRGGSRQEVCDRNGKTYGNVAIFIKTPLKKCDKPSQFSLY